GHGLDHLADRRVGDAEVPVEARNVVVGEAEGAPRMADGVALLDQLLEHLLAALVHEAAVDIKEGEVLLPRHHGPVPDLFERGRRFHHLLHRTGRQATPSPPRPTSQRATKTMTPLNSAITTEIAAADSRYPASIKSRTDTAMTSVP